MTTEVIQGQTFSYLGSAIDAETEEAYNLTGFTISGTFKKFDRAKTTFNVTVGNGITILDAVNGKFRLDIDTSALTSGVYKFEVKFDNGSIVDYSEVETLSIREAIAQ